MFEKFFQYYKDQGKLHPHFEFEIRANSDYYESKSEEVKAKLRRIKDKYSWANRGKYDFDKKYDIHIEFWRGSGNYDTSVCLSSDEGVSNSDLEIGQLISEYFWSQTDEERADFEKKKKAIPVNEEAFPPILAFSYDAVRYELEHHIFYAWFAFLWQEIDGFECQMPVKIIQNNSVDMFSLNDFLWDEYSKFNLFREKASEIKPVGKAYQRDLTLEELFLRADSDWGHWMNQNTNLWKYFEKGDQFIEFGFYNNHTCQRIGKLDEAVNAPIIKLKEWENRKDVLSYMNEFVDQKTKEGWRQKLRPLGLPKKVFDDALEFQVSFNYNGGNPDLSEDAISQFEAKNSFFIPKKYRAFLRLIDGKKELGQKHFMVSNTEAKFIKRIFSLEEIEENLPSESLSNLEFLKIMEIENNAFLCVNVNPSIDKNGRIFLQNSNGDIEGIANDFEGFLSLLCERY